MWSRILGVVCGSYCFWKKRCNTELTQRLGGFDILLFVTISQLKWIGRVSRMHSKEQSVKYIIIPREVNQENDQKTDGGIVYKHVLIDSKLETGKGGQKQR